MASDSEVETDDNELIIKQEDMCQVDIIEEEIDHETLEQQPSLKIRNLKVLVTATFSTLCAGYCSAMGKHSGLFWAYSGRGRFGVFYEVLWIQVG